MAQQDGYSPSFKRPADIMRMRRRRPRSDAAAPGPGPGGPPSAGSPAPGDSSRAGVRPFSPGPLFKHQNRAGGGTKRRNPFASIENTCGPKKKRLVYTEAGSLEARAGGDSTPRTGLPFGGRLAEAERHHDQVRYHELQIHTAHTSPHGGAEVPEQNVTLYRPLLVKGLSEDDSLFEEEEEVQSPLLKSPQAIAPASIAPPLCTEYPSDWSLKTRLLFTSPLTLSWAEHPRAQEEAQGLQQHCRAQFSPLAHSIQDPRACPPLRCAFQQSLVYWQHPSLPWVPLFPRINSERSFSGRSLPWAQDAVLQQSLMGEWSVSLSSLYSLLKARLCPYFYLCSHQFTVLFRAAGLGGSSCITAFISPTTRGLREAMKAEGIEFSLPLVEERRRSREHPEEEEEEQEEESELKEGQEADEGPHDDDEEGSFSWLKEMGIQDHIKKPDSITMQLRKEGSSVALDHKPESVVCVRGPHSFTLVNFLIGCKSLVAAAGLQAGLPPTLLAPGPFRGATMHTLKARCVTVKSPVGSTYQNISSLEITGPILPSSLHSITSLLRPAQKGNFSAALYTHTPTAVMNTHTPTAVMNTHTPTAVMNTHTPTAVMNTHTPTAVMNTHTKQQGSGGVDLSARGLQAAVGSGGVDLSARGLQAAVGSGGVDLSACGLQAAVGSGGVDLSACGLQAAVGSGGVDLSACGLQAATLQQLQQPSSLGKTALTHLNMSNYSYMWKN